MSKSTEELNQYCKMPVSILTKRLANPYAEIEIPEGYSFNQLLKAFVQLLIPKAFDNVSFTYFKALCSFGPHIEEDQEIFEKNLLDVFNKMKGFDIKDYWEKVDEYGRTNLQWAVYSGSPKLVEEFLSYMKETSQNVSKCNNTGCNAIATREKHLINVADKMVEILKDSSVDIILDTNSLCKAMEIGNSYIIKYFIEDNTNTTKVLKTFLDILNDFAVSISNPLCDDEAKKVAENKLKEFESKAKELINTIYLIIILTTVNKIYQQQYFT